MKLLKKLSSFSLVLFVVLTIFGCSENQKEKSKSQNKEIIDSTKIVSEDEQDFDEFISENDTSWVMEGEDSIVVDSGLNEEHFNKNKKQFSINNILRIEGIVSTSWKGVRGCCDQNTVNKQTRKAIEQWVGMQILANRPFQYHKSGIVGQTSQAKCKYKKNKWTGERSCKGSYQQSYYIEFIKQ